MADPIITFTRPEIDELKELYRWWKKNGRTLRSRSDRPQPNEEDDVGGYLVYTPSGGIPALVLNTMGSGTGTIVEDDVPGFVDCEVYKLIQPDTASNTRIVVPAGFTVTVYNMTAFVIDGNKWMTILQDNYGTWYVPPQVSLTATSSGYYLTDFATGTLTADNELTPQTFGSGLTFEQEGKYLILYSLQWNVVAFASRTTDSIAFGVALQNLDGLSGVVNYFGGFNIVVDEPLSMIGERWDKGGGMMMDYRIITIQANVDEPMPITLTTQMAIEPSQYDTVLGDSNHPTILYWQITAIRLTGL